MRTLPALLLAIALPLHAQDTPKHNQRTPVLVELFTSEGCSSCPPADDLLARLQHDQPVPGAEIIALGEHVDYWDQQGWHDRFSSPDYTQRQKDYQLRFKTADIFTPQIVVAGAGQFNGTDVQAIAKAIAAATEAPALPLELSDIKIDGRRVTATLHAGSALQPAPGDLYAALVDPADTTQVRDGENKGRTLHHAAVVRTLTRIASLKDLARGPIHVTIKAPDDPTKMRLIVFTQKPDQGPVLGAASASVAPTPPSIAQLQ
jgi:hypothetical protein